MAERIEHRTKFGKVELPQEWQTEDVSARKFTAWSEEGSVRVTLLRKDFELLSEFLQKRADELRISRYVRSVSREFCKDANADRGGFILGLIPDSGSVAEYFDPEDPDLASMVDVNGSDARYLFVAAYEQNGKLYVMEAETNTASGGTLLLSGIHRSWKLP